MATVRAVYEGGVFRPTGPVALPEGCEVVFEPREAGPAAAASAEQHEPDEAGAEVDMSGVYEVLSRRYDSGETDVAERHNEHQP